MTDFWSALASLLVFVAPMALAWWLLGRPESRDARRDGDKRRGKIPP